MILDHGAIKIVVREMADRALLGEFTITTLYEKFYAKVLEDKDDWFREMFQTPLEDLVANESEYLIEPTFALFIQ